MNIFIQLEKEHSKENSQKIIAYIGNDAERYAQLMDCFFMKTEDYRVPQRAAHVVSLYFDKNSTFIEPYLPRLMERLNDEKLDGALKRNILRVLQFTQIDEEYRSLVYNRSFELLGNPTEAVAVRAFAMTVLYNITEHYIELKSELLGLIEMVLEEPNTSPGIQNRGKKVAGKLYKDLENSQSL
ncbi:MAG: hypothetical protein ACK5IC_02625 [Moheibacter sp.]